MKKIIVYSLLLITLVACKKESTSKSDNLNVSGIKAGDKNEVVNIKLKSGKVSTTNINCYVFSSTIFEPKTSGFGYVGCDSVFYLVNPLTGEDILNYKLPGFLSQISVDVADNSIIGFLYEDNSNKVVKINLNNGAVVFKRKLDSKEGIFSCSHFFNPVENTYNLISSDSMLISINPDNGSIVKSVKVETILENAIFDKSSDRLIGFSYSPKTEKNYIETIDVHTGSLKSHTEIEKMDSYYGCISDFDPETNCYILVNPQNEILFIDIESGKIKESYQLNFDIKEFKFWRSK